MINILNSKKIAYLRQETPEQLAEFVSEEHKEACTHNIDFKQGEKTNTSHANLMFRFDFFFLPIETLNHSLIMANDDLPQLMSTIRKACGKFFFPEFIGLNTCSYVFYDGGEENGRVHGEIYLYSNKGKEVVFKAELDDKGAEMTVLSIHTEDANKRTYLTEMVIDFLPFIALKELDKAETVLKRTPAKKGLCTETSVGKFLNLSGKDIYILEPANG